MTNPTPIAAHTPGPWRADGDEVVAADGYRILDAAGVHRHESHDADKGHWAYEDGTARDIPEGEEEANAILAAAAPDLLAALRTAVSVIEQLIPDDPAVRGVADVVLYQGRAAIAKATK